MFYSVKKLKKEVKLSFCLFFLFRPALNKISLKKSCIFQRTFIKPKKPKTALNRYLKDKIVYT